MRITAKAYAKLNLTLEVLGKRPDGYHEITGISQTISLADELTFETALTLSLTTEAASVDTADNLVLKAARMLQERTRTGHGARIELTKRIPVAGGLGGGSVDAAAALLALNRLWGLQLGPGVLLGMAAELGSDVPYLLHGGTALVAGRGEQVRPLLPLQPAHFVILAPRIDIPNKTATAFRMMRPQHYTKGKVTAVLGRAIQNGEPLREPWQYNAFDTPVFEAYPDLHEWRLDLIESAYRRPHLCGAGPCIYMPVESDKDARRVATRLSATGEAHAFAVSSAPASVSLHVED